MVRRIISVTGLAAFFMLLVLSCSKKGNTPPPPPPPPPPSPTIPACVSNISPANGELIRNGFGVSFVWAASAGATGYDLYIGTSAATATVVASNITTTSYVFSVAATFNITYYWYVVPKNANGSATGCATNATSFTPVYIQSPPGLGYLVVGYFPSYRNPADVPDIKFRMTNVVNYAFFEVTGTGGLNVVSPSTLFAVITKARANNAKVFVSINDGSGDGKTNFKNMAATQIGRTAFAADVMNKVRLYGLDGVDIDWEFPTTSDGTDITFTALIKELSDSLHRDARYYLTAAITAGKYAGGIRDAIRNEIFSYVDWFNIMAYDDFSTSTPYRHHSDYTLATVCLNYWLTTRAMPSAKVVLGLPAYGRPSGITQTGTILTYKTILSQGGNPQLDSAIVTAGGFTNYTIYYNGQYTVKRKAILAKQTAGGVMMWEKWQDAVDNNSLLKAACDTVGRLY